MLFDLKGRRKRLVQVTYVGLAVLFGAGLIGFGVGSNAPGGIVDALKGNGGGNGGSVFQDQVDTARKKVAANPKSKQGWLDLVRAEFNLAASADGSDQQTGQLTDKGQQAVLASANAWERYMKLKPKKPDAASASFAALAYGALQEYAKAFRTQELSTKQRPSPSSYFQLAAFAYSAGEVAKGDAAAAQAVKRTPKDLRNSVRSQVKDAKKQGAQIVKAVAAQKKAAKKANKGTGRGSAFGPLPGQGAGGASTPTP
jgi:hypothetical protein